jgi:hypothetical protein
MNDLSVQTLGRGAGLSRADLPRDIPRETNGIAHAIHSRNTHPSYTDDALLLLQSFSLLSSSNRSRQIRSRRLFIFPIVWPKKKNISSRKRFFQSRFSNVLLLCVGSYKSFGKVFFFWARRNNKEQRGTPSSSCRLMQIQMNLNFPNDDGENEAMGTTHTHTHTTQQRLVNFGIFIIF